MLTDDQWADFEQRVEEEAVPTLHDPLVHSLMQAGQDVGDHRPVSLEDMKRAILGDPDFQGIIEIPATVDGHNLVLRFRAEDLDRVDWNEPPNIVIMDDVIPFKALVFTAKRALAGKRGHLAPTQYPFLREHYEAMRDWTPDDG